MLWELILLVGIMWVAHRRWLLRRQVALGKQLKTKIRTYPILGHTYKFFGSNEDQAKAWEEFGRDALEAGGISKILHFDHVEINVADPVAADILLSQCLEKHDLMKVINLVLGNASIAAPVPVWRHRRKIVAPTFSSKKLIQYVEVFSKQSIVMADLLEKEVDKGTFSIGHYFVICSMTIICETAMGVSIDFNESDVLHAVEELWQLGARIITKQPWLKNKHAMQCSPMHHEIEKHKRTVSDFAIKVIREKQKKLSEKSYCDDKEKDDAKMLSFLDFQLDPSNGPRKLSDLELIEETMMLIIGGYDTTATAASFITLMLSTHADVQDKIYRELQEVFGDSDRAVTYDDILRLKYLDAVIKETLRLYPLTSILGRHASTDVELPSGITVVKGCGVVINVWAIHRNPAYWGDDADQFRPERFFNLTLKHPAAFMPFSYGPRGCPGYRYAMLMMTATLSTLLRRYRVLAPPGVPQGELPKTKFELVIRHVNNFEIQLERRK